ncbi:MAG: divalent-cation tolerance protein CutA [Lysobacterales bacterium]
MSAVLCLTTCPDREGALTLARVLIAEKFAACVNILPGVTSLYCWHGAIEQADEVQLFIKTTQSRVEALKVRWTGLHTYDVPELVVLDVVDGLPAYLEWVAESVQADQADKS